MTTTMVAPLRGGVGVRRVLLAGSGPDEKSIPVWKDQGYEVITLDIDPRNKPDIVGSMTKIDAPDLSFDVIYCCHALEHLYPHEVSRALLEFLRVLTLDGTVFIMVPDLEGVKPTEEPLTNGYTGLHLFYGDAHQIEQYPFMAHHSGFIAETLFKAMSEVGFTDINVRRAKDFNLIGTGKKWSGYE